MRKPISFVLSLLFSFQLTAQISDLVNSSDLVISGKVKFKESKWSLDRTKIVTDYTIQVDEVFQDLVGLNDDLLRVNVHGGSIDDLTVFSLHSIDLNPTQEVYLFLSKDVNQSYRVNNYSMSHTTDTPNEKKIYHDIVNLTKRRPWSINEGAVGIVNDSCDVIDNPATIALWFDNAQFTDTFKYLEFDIMAEVNIPGIKFGRGDIYINYTEEFGTNISQNGGIEVTSSTITSDPIYTVGASDISSQLLKVEIAPTGGSNSLYTFGLTSAPLVHVRINIESYDNIGGLSFDDLTIAAQIEFWCNGTFNPFNEIVPGGELEYVFPEEGAEIGIEYTFENPLCNGNKFNLDIFASTTEASDFSDGHLYIEYSTSAFFPNSHSNSKVIFTKKDVTLSNDYQIILADEEDDQLVLRILNDQTSGHSVLNTTPRRIGTLTWDIQNDQAQKEIKFNDPNVQTFPSLYYTGQQPIPWTRYMPIVVTDEENGSVCGCEMEPEITSFSPMNIPAGAGEILTINGLNFGSYDNQHCKVQFKDGDDGGNAWMNSHVQDLLWNGIIHWTDTKIEIKVPSVDAAEQIRRPAASGKFRVVNECGSDISDDELDIPYALMNRRLGGKPFKITLKGLQQGGICFAFNEDLPTWIRTEFREALHEWCPETEVSFFVDDNTTSNLSNPVDGINVVAGENLSGHAGAAVLFTQRTSKCEQGSEEGFYMIDVDIVINDDYTTIAFPTLDDKINLRNKLKHELGHAHMLNHAVILNEVFPYNQPIVYWSFTASSSGGTQVGIKGVDITGANKLFSNSNSIVSGSCGDPILQSSQCGFSCNTNSVSDARSINKLTIYPNPTNGHFSIKRTNGAFSKNSEIEIHDLMGKKVYVLKLKHTTNEVKVTRSLPQGEYILSYLSNGSVNSIPLTVQ